MKFPWSSPQFHNFISYSRNTSHTPQCLKIHIISSVPVRSRHQVPQAFPPRFLTVPQRHPGQFLTAFCTSPPSVSGIRSHFLTPFLTVCHVVFHSCPHSSLCFPHTIPAPFHILPHIIPHALHLLSPILPLSSSHSSLHIPNFYHLSILHQPFWLPASSRVFCLRPCISRKLSIHSDYRIPLWGHH